jgi:membrane-bound ClpP family serine protease
MAFGLAILLTALRPVGPDSVTSSAAALLIVASALLLLGLPGLYVSHADASGSLGLAGHALLTVGLLVLSSYPPARSCSPDRMSSLQKMRSSSASPSHSPAGCS